MPPFYKASNYVLGLLGQMMANHSKPEERTRDGCLTGCMVPPVTTTARHSWRMGEKWTAGFRSKNFSLERVTLAVGERRTGVSQYIICMAWG